MTSLAACLLLRSHSRKTGTLPPMLNLTVMNRFFCRNLSGATSWKSFSKSSSSSLRNSVSADFLLAVLAFGEAVDALPCMPPISAGLLECLVL